MITKAQEADLLRRGLTQAEINKLTPQQAQEILATPATPWRSIGCRSQPTALP